MTTRRWVGRVVVMLAFLLMLNVLRLWLTDWQVLAGGLAAAFAILVIDG
jgi:hypothetical protein